MFRENQWLTDKFTEALGEFDEILTGNFYITIMHHDAHVDLINEDEENDPVFHNLIPWKSVVFPIFLIRQCRLLHSIHGST